MVGEWRTETVRQLVSEGVLERPIDGNHGEIHPKASDFVNSGIPFIMASDLVNGHVDATNCAFISEQQARKLRKGFAKPGDVLISHKATMGRTALVEEVDAPFLMLTPQVTYYRIKDQVRLSNRYLKYYFDSPSFQQLFETWGHKGSTRAYLGITSQLDLPVVLPPPEEQRAIAHILGTLDDKIELNRRMSETLEAMARSLFKSWFVDFDPVRAKMEGRDPDLPKHLADLFPARLVESELGEIPERWTTTSVGAVCSRVAMGPFGSDIKTDNFVDFGVPVVRGANLKDGFIDDQFVFLTEEKASELKNANAFPGDIVVTHRGTLGQVGLIPKNSRFARYVVSQSQMLLTISAERSLPVYVYMYLRSSVGQHALLANTSQTGVPAIARPTTSVKTIPLLAPSKPILDAFGDIVQTLSHRRGQTVDASRTLSALRDTLLPKLLSGELRVKDAERFLDTREQPDPPLAAA